MPEKAVKAVKAEKPDKAVRTKHNFGQYFTTNLGLKEKVAELILNSPVRILEPSIGRGDLVSFVSEKMNIPFDMYEIDDAIVLNNGIDV